MAGKGGEWRASGGCHDCGGKCPYKVWMEGGRAVRIEPYDDFRPCVRGYAYLQRTYSPERLRTPLKRTGERGEGRFEPISWDQALSLVTEELLRVKAKYGASSILCIGSSGAPGRLHNAAPVFRLLNMFGGFTGRWGSASAEAAYFAANATYGIKATAHTRDDLTSSKLALLWGWNPAETIQGTETPYHLVLAKEKGTKFIVVDPRYTNTAAWLADEWIPVKPGTDTALLLAMGYVILDEGLQDQKFIDTYTVGFEAFKDYLQGKEDGVPKTPSWAEPITGVPPATIERLARQYATEKPAALISGFGPGRTAYGEQFHRATGVLAIITGNIGIHGGNPGCCEIPQVGATAGSNIPSSTHIPIGINPVESQDPLMASDNFSPRARSRFKVNTCHLWDAILYGKGGGFPSDIKLLYVVCANPVNQYPNANKGVEAIKGLEFIVVHEQFMTATAKLADIILPANTHWERTDLMRPWLGGPYFFFADKVMEPLYESKSDFQICTELAERLGIAGYREKSEEEWVKQIVLSSPDTSEAVSDYEAFKKGGVHLFKGSERVVAFQKEIENPEMYRFPTPSGKIEIFSQRLAGLNDPNIPPIPKFIPPWEGNQDPLSDLYPLQLITYHSKTRAHSCFYNVPWLRELEPHQLWINVLDAQERGIIEGEMVRVFNERGEIQISVHVTHRIMPGVVAMGEGTWYGPDERGVDLNGCANVLTRDLPSPAGALASNTSLVQVEKAERRT
ncbi:MAG: molybdopterin-dependent oxidoreductase [Pseudomonadota bacterium]